jgi:hypothetical protein
VPRDAMVAPGAGDGSKIAIDGGDDEQGEKSCKEARKMMTCSGIGPLTCMWRLTHARNKH